MRWRFRFGHRACFYAGALQNDFGGEKSQMFKTTLKVIFYAALTLFSIFAIYIVDDRRMSAFAAVFWLFAFYSEWRGDRDKAKAKEADKLKQLVDRVAYLERQQRP
jgi:hypothetical protein